jgi:hypothetical protein
VKAHRKIPCATTNHLRPPAPVGRALRPGVERRAPAPTPARVAAAPRSSARWESGRKTRPPGGGLAGLSAPPRGHGRHGHHPHPRLQTNGARASLPTQAVQCRCSGVLQARSSPSGAELAICVLSRCRATSIDLRFHRFRRLAGRLHGSRRETVK